MLTQTPLASLTDILRDNPGWLDEAVNEAEASRITNTPQATLQTKRVRGGGPPFTKVGKRVLYIRREKQDEIWSTLGSYNYDNYDDGAFRFMQYGTGSPALIYGLKAALDFNRKIGIERIARWNFALTRQLHEGLRDISNVRIYSGTKPELWAGATTFGLSNKSAAELQDALWAAKIRVRAQGSNKRVRLSAHLYVNPDDIARTLDIVRALAKG